MRRTRALLLALATVAATLLPVASSTFTGATADAATASAKAPVADGRIAFVRHNQIFTMGPGGRAVVKLTSAGKNYRPQWSPDGRRISYIHEAGGAKDVWVMNAGGGGKRAVTKTGDITSAGAPWSPNGLLLAFSSPVDDNGFPTNALQSISSTTPAATPTVLSGYATGGECGGPVGEPGDPQPTIFVDTYLAWSPAAGGSRIAVKTSDCRFDYAIGYLPRRDRRVRASGRRRRRLLRVRTMDRLLLRPDRPVRVHRASPWATTATTPARGNPVPRHSPPAPVTPAGPPPPRVASWPSPTTPAARRT